MGPRSRLLHPFVGTTCIWSTPPVPPTRTLQISWVGKLNPISPVIRGLPRQAPALPAHAIWKLSSSSRIEKSTNHIVIILTSHSNMTRWIPGTLADSSHPTSMLFRLPKIEPTLLVFSSTDTFADYFTTPEAAPL